MKRHHKNKTRYYQSYSDDFVESKKQSFMLPEDYVWIHQNTCYRIAAGCLYIVCLLFCFLYCHFYLHLNIKNRTVLKPYKKSGFFLYSNHTQPVGDAIAPFRVLFPKRCYILASPANLGIPFLGRLLPMLGALPIPSTIGGMRKLKEVIDLRISGGKCVIIYPEAHVWPWYTGIRPYPDTSFAYPAAANTPCFCMSTTYQKRKYGKRPRTTIYLDGPFYPDSTLCQKEQKKKLHDQIYQCMRKRSQNSTIQYIKYEKGDR